MIWYVLFGVIALMVVFFVISLIAGVFVGVKHRNDPDPPLSGYRDQ